MSASAIAVLLICGAALELFGIALVGWDVIDAQRSRAELSHQDKLVQAGTATATAGGIAPTAVTGAPEPEPTVEQRVEALEREALVLGRKLDALDEREKRDHRAMLDQVSGWVAEARRETFELRQELRPLIGSAVAGSITRRAVGVGLFACGLALQTVANVAAL